MKLSRIEHMKGGWFIGDFEPSVLRTKEFEVCFKRHFKGEIWETHYHKEAIEINYLIHGTMKINEMVLVEGDIFTIEKNEVSTPEFLTDCELIVVKTPSVVGDKFITIQEKK